MRKQLNTYEYQTLRSIKRKLYLIDIRGGKCSICGYNKNIAAFDFHHRDPSSKKFQLDQRTLSNHSMKVIMEEFEKCDLLCSNCHREHHSPDLEIQMVRNESSLIDDKYLIEKIIISNTCEDCGCIISKWGRKCKICLSISKRKVERPDISILKEEVIVSGYSAVGRKYNVSGKTIKKWVSYLT